MTPVHVHLMLNHFSIIGSIFGLVLLAVAMVRNSRELTTVSFACLASVAIISIPVYFTGPPAEEAIQHLAGISEEVVDRHEEAAQFAFTAIECVGALALAGLWLFRTEPQPRWFLVILLVGSLLTAGVMIYTANQGRRIRHPEITSSSRLADCRQSLAPECFGLKRTRRILAALRLRNASWQARMVKAAEYRFSGRMKRGVTTPIRAYEENAVHRCPGMIKPLLLLCPSG